MKKNLVLGLMTAGAMIGSATMAHASIVINEALDSTPGADSEFIELYNTGGSSVDLAGWSIELYESDSGSSSFGGFDGGSPYLVTAGTIAAGGYFTFGNALAEAAIGFTADVLLPSNAIENSSYTMALKDNLGAVIETIFVTRGLAGDVANVAGVAITPDITFGPDGTFLPAGFYRVGDGSSTLALLEFDQNPASATPGAANLPEPASLVLMGLGGLLMLRRRKTA